MKLRDYISSEQTDKSKPFCSQLFQSLGHKNSYENYHFHSRENRSILQRHVIVMHYVSANGNIIAIQDLEHIPDDNRRHNFNHYAQDKQLKIWGSARFRYSG